MRTNPMTCFLAACCCLLAFSCTSKTNGPASGQIAIDTANHAVQAQREIQAQQELPRSVDQDKPLRPEQVTGVWQYVKISDSTGQSRKPVGEADCMALDAGRFRYHLNQANIHAQGTWKIDYLTLHFAYADAAGKPKGSLRKFQVWRLKERETMTLKEDSTGLYFHYKFAPDLTCPN